MELNKIKYKLCGPLCRLCGSLCNKKSIIILAALLPLFSNAQKKDSIKLPKVEVLARVAPGKITLRWAPDNANAWLLGNRFGYTIERYTFLKNGKVTNNRQKTILTSSPLKPWPLERWEKMADTCDYAAVVAQAIHGNDFEVDMNKNNDIYSVFNKAKESESRYTFALHSVNQSIPVAEAAALSFTDTTIRRNEAYLYRVYISIPKEIMRMDTGILFVDAGKVSKLPKLREVMVATSGNTVMLSWNTIKYDRDYVSYTVERSDDGGQSFHSLSPRPYVNLGSGEATIPGRAVYLDSVPQYNVAYFYRIKGRSSFAETGPPSDSVKAVAQKAIYNSPVIKSANIFNGKIALRWEVSAETNEAVNGYFVERSTSPQGDYSRLNKSLLPPGTTTFVDSLPASSNYYRVQAMDKKGNMHASLPYFMQPEDSIPPVPPAGLTGTIDSTGMVHLTWLNNTEADLLGYRVFRSYFTSAEFVQVTKDPIRQNQFSEKIALKNLNKYLYYKVTASDKHHNLSGFSSILRLRQPDIMPPAPPAITSMSATDKGIRLAMVPSSSDDVEKYVVYRKEGKDTVWTLEKVIASTVTPLGYTDSTAQYGTIYTYNVLAVDSSGNESIPARSVKCRALNSNNKAAALTLLVTKDPEKKAIELKWSSVRSDIVTVLIYKAIGEDPIAQYATCKAVNGSFMDNNVRLNNTYRYMIKAIYADGTESGFSKTETINY